MAKTQIKNYVFKPGLGALDNRFPNAYSLILQNKEFIQKEATAWIADQVAADAIGFVGYTYNSSKCERDIGYNIDAYLKDLRHGGNQNTYNTIKYYWDQDVAQIDGDRQPEIQTYGFIKSLITNNILTNTLYSASNLEIAQTIDISKTSEDDASGEIEELVDNTIDVITSGLNSLPTLVETGVGTIKIQGRYDLEDILLITNTTSNEIIYNFSNPATGGTLEQKTDKVEIDANFPKYLETTDAITLITLNYNTIGHASTDELQIFVEEVENGKSVITTRPYDFGSDAIERMRVAQPLSMLDADFEYGLQPTKWAAIATLRGYPSVYEIPGTDTPVLRVVTDASAGTEGIGQSLITVTTVSPHGIEAGTPITIKALEDTVVGAARAEGSFIVVSVPTPNSLTFFAKSKVGTNNGDVLSTTYTQLRQAGFYTGATIGSASFSVNSQGSAGTLVAELDIAAGSTILPYDGPSPETGAPLVNDNITEGTQITGVRSTSAGGGVYVTPTVVGDYGPGVTTIDVEDATGIVDDLAVDRGDGIASYVTEIVDDAVTFSIGFDQPIIGNITTYENISGTNVESNGVDAEFDVSKSAGLYTVSIANDGGVGFEPGDRILITGDNLGGLTPDHDLSIIVTTTVSDGAISTFTSEGTAFAADEDVTVSDLGQDGGVGTGATFDITYSDNVYDTVDISSPDESIDYAVNDVIVIPGDQLTPNGTTPTNDLKIKISSVGVSGGITGVAFSGTAPDGYANYDNPAYTYTGAGTNFLFTVTRDGTAYSLTIDAAGQDFLPTETITIAGTELGGLSPANDLTITIDNVDGNGGITAESLSGIAANAGEDIGISGTNVVGAGATIDITLDNGTYSAATVQIEGTNFDTDQTITILGDALLGETPANDLVLTVDTVNASGGITGISITSGTAVVDERSFNNVPGPVDQPVGTGATFNITRSNQLYAVAIANQGSDYKVSNRILITGDNLGGETPLNDLEIVVDQVEGSAILDDSTGFTESYEEAAAGVNLDLFSTVSISEATTDTISKGDPIDYELLATLEVSFTNAHGLIPGNTFITSIQSDDGTNNHALAAGSFFASDIPDTRTLNFQARAAGFIDTSTEDIQGEVYPRPDSFFIHRPFDGGVQLGTGGPQHGAQAIRQSKKYIRYQSGKGIMYTTGALFAPSYDLRSVTAEGVEVGSLITIVTDDNDHGVQVGGIVRLLGIETPGYNSGPETAVPPQFDYEVVDVVDERTFKIRSQRRLGATDAVLGFGSQMSVVSWHGATVRSGIFDDQNGIFWEFDGTQISVVQRTGTRQLAGTVAMTVDNNLVTGTNTRFRDQLKAGDRIIIKGMTHVVSHVNSQTELTVTPDWRGVVDIGGSKVNLIVDKKTKQEDFNLDRLDGTGPSGYDIDVAKMQMIGIQYSWYGAGFIDFMLRGADGNFVFAHRMRNSNVNTEAFMRSGNLPVRYEVSNEGPSAKLAQAMDSSQDTATLDDASFFPQKGTIYIDNEIMTFNGVDGNTLQNVTRGATFSNFQAGSDRSYTASDAVSHDARTGVILISQTITPLISHWGSAFITDGLFDEDRGYIFSYAENGITVSTTKQTAFLIRLAPSVSNALTGDLGERELLNRAQLLLQGIEITSDGNDGTDDILGGIVIEGILNPQNYPLNPDDIGWSGLSGVAQGGQPSFAEIASGGSVVWSTGEAATTANISAQSTLTATLNSGQFGRGGNTNFIYVSATDYRATFGSNDNRFVVGKTITGAAFRSNTTITDASISSSSNYGWFRLSRNTQSSISANTVDAYTILEAESLSNRNFGLFTKASVDLAGARTGTTITGGSSVSFPANTSINSIELKEFAGTEYYEVQFNNSFSGTLSGGDTVELTFSQPPFAQPGETVFSFIATPGERSTLDLSELKELTNTPLGGRGTFPNGPDVLAINVYKVKGADVDSNIILRWGEAQA